MNKRTVRVLVTISFATMLVILYLLAGVSLFTLMRMSETIAEVVEETTEEGQPILELLHTVQSSDHIGHDYLTYGTDYERSRYEEITLKTIASFERALKAPYKDELEKELVRRAFIKWRVVHNLTLANISSNDPAVKLKYMRKIDSQLEEIKEALLGALDRAQYEMGEMEASTSLLWEMTSIFIIFISIVALVLSVFLWNWLVRGITGPLERLAQSVKAVGIGERPIETEGLSDDEMGRLIRAVNDLTGRVYEDTSRLDDPAEYDELTGLYNHRALLNLLNKEVSRCQRYKRSFSFILLDVDNFKQINDKYGHLAGDEAIRQLATMILDSIRDVDKAARYDGDEIAVILPETKGAKALAVAERIRLFVATQHVLLPGGQMESLKISLGLSEYPGGKDTSMDVISAANEALFEAKRKGRNTVCVDSWLKKSIA